MKSMLTRGFVPLLIALGGAACAVGTPAPAEAADVCAQRGSAQEAEIRHDGANRNYRIVVPASEEPLPLVMALHGGWGTGEAMAEQTGLDAAAARHGFAVVYPNGSWRAWNAGSCCGRPASNNVDDVGFLRKLAGDLGAQDCIDGDRVYGTGFSNGAMMVHRMACDAPGVFKAIAPVAGGPMVESCKADSPVPALLMVGREDERIPWDGGVFKESYRPGIAEQVEQLATRNRCDESSSKAAGSGGYCEQRAGCDGGALRWCIIDGVGHQWPGGSTILQRLLGPNRDVIDASDTILRFFADN